VSQWVRNAVMMIVVLVWALVVITSLVRGILPDAITWGVPGGIWFAMNPTIPRRTQAPDQNGKRL
jgi:hypothetical protein